jgi:hypothetical protein
MSTLLTGSNPHPTPHRNPPLAGDYLARLARRCLLIVPNAWSFGYPKPQASAQSTRHLDIETETVDQLTAPVERVMAR